jgi:hypothetical protein
MPYIDEKTRIWMSNGVKPLSPGELNYKITELCTTYLKAKNYKGGHWDYRRVNEIMGALECAKQEFYRRVAVPYENEKCLKNGDVY